MVLLRDGMKYLQMYHQGEERLTSGATNGNGNEWA